ASAFPVARRKVVESPCAARWCVIECMLRSLCILGVGLATVCSSSRTIAQPAKVADGWSRSAEAHGRKLSYSDDVTILGQPSRLNATFYCNTERTKMATGAIGFDLAIDHPDAIKGFHFDDFEGPDAPAGKRQLLTATIVRANGTKQRFQGAPSGSYTP